LCILKGIFPKDPKKKFKGINKTYYYLKDIQFLSHEKLLQKFRDLQTYEKKIKKARAKKEKYDENKLKENKPKYSIDHILKERYPRFNDAVNDLDDALCLITLFSTLPKHELLNIKPEIVQMCQRLKKEFYLYCAISQNFKKGFISIKGIYMNVELMGNEVTWLCPFNYPQKLTFEIDYDIMLNFLELYTNLMKFVNMKLFKDIGMEYPPPLENLDSNLFGFNSSEIMKIQQNINSNSNRDKAIVIFIIYYFS
jgi:pescadillo protein